MKLAPFFNELRKTSIQPWADELEEKSGIVFKNANHGDFVKWVSALNALPAVEPSSIDLSSDAVTLRAASGFGHPQAVRETLMKLHPWRKGPFDFFGIQIDTEWRSNLKWDRVAKAIQPLKDRVVLDLGCGNGYYLWRMLGVGAKLAMGVDPSLQFAVQFQVFQNIIQDSRTAVLPLGIDDLPENLSGFDTVFSMGLLYHRRDPLEHLKQLRQFLRPGGELVLETLVIDGGAVDILRPGERYAKMRNVWSIPSCAVLKDWLDQAEFARIRCADVTVTTSAEQRKTAWMEYESLEDFLNPADPSHTVEGHPAPKRAIFIAER